MVFAMAFPAKRQEIVQFVRAPGTLVDYVMAVQTFSTLAVTTAYTISNKTCKRNLLVKRQ